MGLFSRILGRCELPPGFSADLGADERVVASAELVGGGHVVVTSWGLWLPDSTGAATPSHERHSRTEVADESAVRGPRRIGWHLVSKAAWKDGAILLVEAVEERDLGGVVVLADQRPRRLRLASPGAVPQEVHARVTGSIRSRHHRDLPGGGAWFVQRKVPGRDGVVMQVRPDPGTDPDVVAALAADVAATLQQTGVDLARAAGADPFDTGTTADPTDAPRGDR